MKICRYHGFAEPWWKELLLTNRSRGRFRFTSISLRTGLTDSHSLTNLKTDQEVELQMTGLPGVLEQTSLLKLNVLISWLTLLSLRTLRLSTLMEQINLVTFDGLTSLLKLLTLQTLHSVTLLEQIDLVTFNGVMSCTVFASPILLLVVLLDETGLLTFND